MNVKIEFNMDNSDFDVYAEQTIRKVLDKAVEFILNDTIEVGILRDINGNRIGTVVVTEHLDP